MFLRQAARSVGITAAIGASAGLCLLALSGTAGADVPNASQITAVTPQSPFNTGNPFASGQTITITVPPNTLFTNLESIHIVECDAGPGGTVPTGTPVCDNNTQYGNTVTPLADGSFTVTDDQVFALPSTFLGETSSNATQCGSSTNQCILYIGLNQGDISQNHIWSQGFQVVKTDAGETGTVNPGDGTPEVPLAVGLPLAAAGLIGGTMLIKRRKAARAA